jgi:hypothetical protein
MEFSYLGKYAAGKANVGIYFESREQVVVSVLSDGNASLVQAFKKLALKSGHLKKGLDLSALHSILSTHSATMEFVTTRPTADLVDRVTPSRDSTTAWLEHALQKLDEEIAAAKDEYARWRGVRDLDEAHENLANRRDEIFDLNQKLIANAREPSFVYSPTKWVPSEWQRTDRVRFHELKDQAKEKVSSLRSRIDFTYRDRIKQLEEKRRDLTQQVDAERKKDAQHDDAQTALLEDGLAANLLLTVRSRSVFTTRPVADSVRAASREVQREAAALKAKLQERLALKFDETDDVLLLTAIFVPDTKALARRNGVAREFAEVIERSLSLTPRLAAEKETAKIIAQLLSRVNEQPRNVGDLPRFPNASDAAHKRLIYLGKALDSVLAQTEHLVFYDLDAQGPRHTAVSGGSGSGKSVAARLLVEGAALHGVPSVIFDPTRSWTGMATPCVGSLLKRYESFLMKPEWARAFEMRILGVEPFGTLDARESLEYPGLSVIPAWTLAQEEERTVVVRLLQSVQKALAGWPESQRLRAMLVFEEAHRYLQGGELEGLLELLARTARAKGLGLLFVSQNNVDLPPGVRNNTATRFQMQTAYGPDLTRAAQTFGSEFAKKIPMLQQGTGAIHYPEYGATLVAFRPPLCNPHAIAEDVVRFYQTSRELSRVTQRLLAMKGIPDGGPLTDSLPTNDTPQVANSETPPNANTALDNTTLTHDWRVVGQEFVSRCQTKPSVLELAAAIRTAGLKPPTERTLYRFLRSTKRASE